MIILLFIIFSMIAFPLPMTTSTILKIDQGFDIYNALDSLWIKMVKLNLERHAILYDSIQDSLDIENEFINYEYNIDTISSGIISLTAKLPPYLGNLTTSLTYHISKSKDGKNIVQFVPSLKFEKEGFVFDDSVFIAVKGQKDLPIQMHSILTQRLHLYRTLALSKIYTPSHIITSRSIYLNFHGRELKSLEYASLEDWIYSMKQLAAGMNIYSGPYSLKIDGDQILLEFYISMSKNHSLGHHFFIIKERFVNNPESTKLLDTRVDFYPFVRVDNLLSLFGEYTKKYQKPPTRIIRRNY